MMEKTGQYQTLEAHLLAEPLGIGPGQRFRKPADGHFLAIAVCHKYSPRNMLAQCLLTHDIWTHSWVGNRVNISTRRCSGRLPIGPSPLSVIRLSNREQKEQVFGVSIFSPASGNTDKHIVMKQENDFKDQNRENYDQVPKNVHKQTPATKLCFS